jgi:hypothetical protein
MEPSAANDRTTYMTDLQKCLSRLESEGFTEQYRVEEDRLVSMEETNNRKYKPEEVMAVNFFRFEGPSNPDDMSILYAIETTDGHKGTLVDAYGLYADEDTGAFFQNVEIHKKVNKS